MRGMIKLIITIITIVAICLITLVGCSDTVENIDMPGDQPEEDSEDENVIITVAIFDFPPYMNVDGDEYTGPAIDVLREVFYRIGYIENEDYKIVVYPWVRTLDMLRTGDLDMAADILDTPERREYLDYSNEYHTIEQMVFITPKDSDIDYDGNLDSISYLTFGTLRGFRYSPEFNQAVSDGLIKVDESENPHANIEKMLVGRIEIIIEVKAVAQAVLIELDAVDEVKILDPPLQENYSYFGFSKASKLKDLRDLFDEKLRELREDGTEEEIYAKYFGRE